MSTTIDNIQIEIQSNSSNAAQGIDALANSLKKLKENGAFGVAVKNLNNLSAALKGFKVDDKSVDAVGRLAKNLGELKGVSALKDINRMMNGLGKLKDVTAELDDKTIGEFVARVKKLSDELTPLAGKLTTVAQAFRGINAASNTAGKSLGATGKKFSLFGAANFVTAMSGAIATLSRIVQGMVDVIEAASEWEGIAARFGRGFGDQAQEVYDWIQRLNKEMGINVQQFMQYSSVYATMLKGFGVANEDAAKMALGYTELTYDIWAGYNDIYKTFGEAAEAVKSAIAGEVEPVRRAGFTIVEATLEQTAANHGLEISLENATEAQKSYLRYLTLVDQAHAQNLVGTYAKELNTAEGVMRTFSQQLKSLTQAFGSLFLPILVKVMPYVQAFVELLTDAVRAVAAFFGIKIQDISGTWGAGMGTATENTDGLADSAGNATKKLKELKNATIGIDELNVISPPTDNSGGGKGNDNGGAGGAGLDVDSLWDESIFDSIQSKVDELKEKVKGFLPIVGGIAAAFAGWRLTHFVDDLVDGGKELTKFHKAIKKIGKALAVVGITIVVSKLVWDFTGAYLEGADKNGLLKAIGSTVLGSALAGFLAGGWGAGIVIATSGIVTLKRLSVELDKGNIKMSDPKALMTGLVGAIETVIGSAVVIDAVRGGKWSKAIVGAISNGLMKTFGGTSFAWIGSSFSAKLTTALGSVATLIAAHPVIATIVGAVVTAVAGTLALGFANYDFTNVGKAIGKGLARGISWLVNGISSIGNAIYNVVDSALSWVVTNFDINNVWELINLIFNPQMWTTKLIPKMIEIGAQVLPGLWKGIKGWWNNLCANVREFIDGFVEGWNEGFEINSPSKVFERMGGFLISGLWNGITGWFGTLISNISTFITNTINNVKKFFGITGSTSSTFKTVGSNLVQGIIDGIKGMGSSLWNSLKKWADGVIANVKGFFGIHSPSRVAKDQIGTPIVQGLVQGVTDKATALVKPMQTMWNNAKNWWNKSKGNLSFTPTVGNLAKNLQSAWNSAKKWWSKNVKLSIPSLNLSVSYSNKGLNAIKKGVVKALGLPGWPSLKFAANGGMFDQGSLVWAGERGAEIVANASGGRTGVMNIEQMQQAVYEGVYAAMLATVQKGDSQGGSFNIYIDGRQITAAVEKRQRERGASIMGSEIRGFA